MEIKVNVAEVSALLQVVGEVAGSFNTQPTKETEDLDMMATFGDIKNELDDCLTTYMRAAAGMQELLQSQIQTYDKVDQALATKIGSN
ncbi:DUF5344 family protein [Halalkalibacterium halodurans]|jgi:hypothetical protein|uniref:Uncharacterized protein n=1 Tax=Halalkalibacterium halodurans TaxID=86665 RepID=A0A0M0KGH9_ALKHA|nr:DUF5344 family protein [Halalkalibacterium halodurans]TPE68352.1 hypothetical protein AMD02_014130 [Halalkalibacterium halodurans]